MTCFGAAEWGLQRWERSQCHSLFFTCFYHLWSSAGAWVRERGVPWGETLPPRTLRQVHAEEKVFPGLGPGSAGAGRAVWASGKQARG